MIDYQYYIDGQEVSAKTAKQYLIDGYIQSTTKGFWSSADGNIHSLWTNRKTEQGRENIHNVTGIQEKGGLEIIAEEY